MPDNTITTPVEYIGQEDGFIYDANDQIVCDLDSMSDGSGADDSHPGQREWIAARDEVGAYIAAAINAYPEIEELRKEVERLPEQESCCVCGALLLPPEDRVYREGE